jgi:hypothetical protein
MVNTWGAPTLHGALVSRIIDSYIDAPPRDWSADALARHQSALQREAEERKAFAAGRPPKSQAPRPLKDYAGTYEAKLWGDFVVRFESDRLTLQVARGQIADLCHWEQDRFLIIWRDPVWRTYFYGTLAVFGVDDDGHVSRLSMILNRDSVDATRRP